MDNNTPYIVAFIDYLKFEKRYSQHTIRAYSDDLDQFFTFLSSNYGELAIGDVIASFIRTWLANLKNDGMTGKSLNRKISTLKSFFKFHIRQGNLLQNPTTTLSTPKISKRLPVFANKQEMELLFNHVEFPDDWTGRTEKLVLQLLYQTGMRLSELINLKENQVDKYQASLKILGKGNKERILPCNKLLIEEMVSYTEAKRTAISNADISVLLVGEKGRKLYPFGVWRIVNKYLKLVTSIDKKSPHVLRHSFATHLMNNGAELNAVKDLLGHSSLAATQIYTHNTIEKLKDVYKKAHPKA
ncbi:MAG: tyrosine-type recombinase/integrase [Chitinophagaceae bacterium]